MDCLQFDASKNSVRKSTITEDPLRACDNFRLSESQFWPKWNIFIYSIEVEQIEQFNKGEALLSLQLQCRSMLSI